LTSVQLTQLAVYPSRWSQTSWSWHISWSRVRSSVCPARGVPGDHTHSYIRQCL